VGFESEDRRFALAVRREVGEWRPGRGPDLRDLMERVERRPWRATVAVASTIGAAAVAMLLLLAVATVLLAPTLPGGEVVKEHLVQTP
jgi:hypothetical protein